MYEALDVAKFIIDVCNKNEMHISNLKLQKLLHFIWVDYYKAANVYLFNDDICAWELGPVVPDVYYKYCPYGGMSITQHEYQPNIDEYDAGVLEEILKNYADKSASYLVNKAHEKKTAWYEVYDGGKGSKRVIPKDLIIEKEIEN